MARRPTTRMGRSSGGGAPRSRRSVPQPSKSPLPLLLGIGGGVLLLIIIIAVVASGGGSAPQTREATHEAIHVNHTMQKENTGRIMFVCSGSDKHEDKEVYIDVCTKCYQQSTFFWNAPNKGFVCFKCSYLFDREKIVCDKCGEEPKRTVRIKPKR